VPTTAATPVHQCPYSFRARTATSTTNAASIGNGDNRTSRSCGSIPVTQLVAAMSAYTNQW
jgi:hypothetical protein